jgi:hypothetical protein
LFALLGAAALIGLGGAALLMYLGRGNPQPVASPGRVAETREERDDANLAVSPADSSVVIAPVGERNVVAIDASVPIRPVRPDARIATATSPIDAGVATASLSDANAPRFTFTRPAPHETVEQTLERLRVSPEQVFAANPKAVDPVAEYRSFATRVMPLGGKTTRLNTFRIHHANAQGLVNVTANGSLEIFFSSPGLAKAGEDCYFLFIFEDGVGRFHRAEQGEKDDCTSGVMPPRCSLTEIIARATTKGMVIGKSGVTFNRFTRGWQVSSDDFSEFIDDDCE